MTTTLKNNPISKASSIIVADCKQTLWQWSVWLSAACVALFIIMGAQYVHEQKVANLDQGELLCLAGLAFHEARNQGEEGMLATMIVAKNRADMGFRGKHTICDVAHDPKQFSYADSFSEGPKPSLEELVRTVAISDNPFDLAALEVADRMAIAVLLNNRQARKMFDLLNDADHYLTAARYEELKKEIKDGVRKKHWAINPDMHFIAQVGDHKFFRWEG